MAWNEVRLADSQYVGSSAAAVVTNAASTKTQIKTIVLFNQNTTTETVKIYRVPDNAGAVGTAGVANQIYQLDITTKQTVMIEVLGLGWVLSDTNDTIQMETTTASKVVVAVDGVTQ